MEGSTVFALVGSWLIVIAAIVCAATGVFTDPGQDEDRWGQPIVGAGSEPEYSLSGQFSYGVGGSRAPVSSTEPSPSVCALQAEVAALKAEQRRLRARIAELETERKAGQ